MKIPPTVLGLVEISSCIAYLTLLSQRVHMSFHVISVCVCYAFMSVCLLMPCDTCWERADLLALVYEF